MVLRPAFHLPGSGNQPADSGCGSTVLLASGAVFVRMAEAAHLDVIRSMDAGRQKRPTMAGVARSDLAELARFGQVLGDAPIQPPRLRTPHSLHPRPRLQTLLGALRIRKHHDAFGRVVEIYGRHICRVPG